MSGKGQRIQTNMLWVEITSFENSLIDSILQQLAFTLLISYSTLSSKPIIVERYMII